jgi:Protein kinase domain
MGGMAEVFLATRLGAEGFERSVAVKRVLPCFSELPEFTAMFLNEARLAGRLSHPNVVAVLDFDRDAEGGLLLAMEYVDGVTLARLADAGALPYAVTIFIVGELLSGLEHAHSLRAGRVQGIVHRDVTPNNVLLSWEGAVKLADFGIAKALSGATASVSMPVKGKPGYTSPEQLGSQKVDQRSDLFAVGVVLWELLAGRRLFRGGGGEIVAQILFRDVPRPGACRRGVPPEFEDIAMRLLARDPAERYQTARNALDDLARVEVAPAGRRGLAGLLAERFTRGDGETEPRRREPPVSQRWGPDDLASAPKRTMTAQVVELPPPAPGLAIVVDDCFARRKRAAPISLGFNEYIKLLDAMHRSPERCRSRNLALAHLRFHLGLAPEVLAGLELDQLDIEARALLRVRVADSYEPKTIPFNDLICAALQRYAEDRRSLARGAARAPLFLTKRGKGVSPRAMQELLRGR